MIWERGFGLEFYRIWVHWTRVTTTCTYVSKTKELAGRNVQHARSMMAVR